MVRTLRCRETHGSARTVRLWKGLAHESTVKPGGCKSKQLLLARILRCRQTQGGARTARLRTPTAKGSVLSSRVELYMQGTASSPPIKAIGRRENTAQASWLKLLLRPYVLCDCDWILGTRPNTAFRFVASTHLSAEGNLQCTRCCCCWLLLFCHTHSFVSLS